MNTSFFTKVAGSLFMAGLICAFTSCSFVDDRYDIDTYDISMSINVGANLEFPVGDFQVVPLDSMMAESCREYFKEWGEGYVFTYPGIFPKDVLFGSFDVKGLADVDTENIRISTVEFRMELRNTLPMSFVNKVSAIDSDGNVLEHVKVDMTSSIPAGNRLVPSKSSFVLKVTPRNGVVDFDGFHIDFLFDGVPSSGTFIAKEQGIQIVDSYLVFPDGITFFKE